MIRPNAPGKFPLISFAHGWMMGGTSNPFNTNGIHGYDDFLNGLASQGYVVLAAKAAWNTYCWSETKDQIRTIEWARTAPEVMDLIDWNVKVGITGHSMGGNATKKSSLNAPAVQEHNIGAAFCINPVYNSDKGVQVPIFFGSGQYDSAVPSYSVGT